MLLFFERFSRQTWEGSWSVHKSEVSIIDTNGVLLNPWTSSSGTPIL
jgi:hypothetical protein